MVMESPYLLKFKTFLKDFDWQSEVHGQHVSKSSPSLTDFVNDSLSDLVSIKVQRLEDLKKLILEHLNINSIRNKSEMMVYILSSFSICLISESALDSSFPKAQFKINGYTIFKTWSEQVRWGSSFICKWRNNM